MLEQLKAAKLKKAEVVVETKAPLPVICGGDEDYRRLMEETYAPSATHLAPWARI
jgi:hypothetical protein